MDIQKPTSEAEAKLAQYPDRKVSTLDASAIQ